MSDTTNVTGDTKSNGASSDMSAGARLIERLERKKTARKIKGKPRGGSAIRRPGNNDWFRTREGWITPVYLLRSDDGSGDYIVSEDVAEELGDRCYPGYLVGVITLHGDVLLVPMRDSDNDWATSLHEAVTASEHTWVQVVANQRTGRYDWSVPSEPVDEPVWPKRTWEEIFDASTKGRYIDSLDHEIVQRVLYAKI
jgi:hypothetical protein